MKISKLFHTLYAFLMFLPVMVLPLFAININQKEVEPLTAQIEETKVVDFNQLVNFSSNDVWGYDNGSFVKDSLSFQFTYEGNDIEGLEKFVSYRYSHVINDVYLVSFSYISDRDFSYQFVNGSYNLSAANVYTLFQSIATCSLSGADYFYDYVNNVDWTLDVLNYQIFNLTQMFGSGNEPTLQQFNTWYPNDYYEYTTGRNELLYTGVSETLDNTDVGSQFLYSLYNPLKDYFNLPNYMNLGGLYDWFLVNLFNGYNTPVYFIIFTLMIYWLALSLLWLIFDVLMYVPSMIHKMLDKARME